MKLEDKIVLNNLCLDNLNKQTQDAKLQGLITETKEIIALLVADNKSKAQLIEVLIAESDTGINNI